MIETLLKEVFGGVDETPEHLKELAEQCQTQIKEEDEALEMELIPCPRYIYEALHSAENQMRLRTIVVSAGPVDHVIILHGIGCDCCKEPELKALTLAHLQRIGGDKGKVISRKVFMTAPNNLVGSVEKFAEFVAEAEEAKADAEPETLMLTDAEAE